MSNENQRDVSDDAADGQSYDAVDAKNNDGDDAASTVGRMLGLGDQEQHPPVTPAQLVERFCADITAMRAAAAGDAGSAAELHERLKDMSPDPPVGERDDEQEFTRYRGFCGYSGGRGDLMVTGFDDGYTFMGHLDSHGWRSLPAKGDWPFVVYLLFEAPEPDGWAIAEYCEADLTVWCFDSAAAASKFYKTLKDCD